MKLLFKLLEKVSPETIDAYVKKRWVKPVGFEELDLAFVDDSGLKWYEFPLGLSNPIKRIEKQIQFTSLLTARISPEAFDLVMSSALESANKGKFLEAFTMIRNYQNMRENIVPIDVFINAIASDLIREDESITEVNETIHNEKCAYLMKCVEENRGFFFRLKDVNDLLDRFKISTEDFKTLSNGFRAELEKLKKDVELIRSMNLD